MRAFLIGVLAGCASSVPPPTKPCPTCPVAETPEPAVPVQVIAPAIDDAKVVALAEDFFASIDRDDRAAFERTTSPTFVQFIYGRTYDRKVIVGALEGRTNNKLTPRTRACEQARIVRGTAAAVYVAKCKEQFSAHGDMPAHTSEKWHTVALAPESGAWTVVYYTFQLAGIETEREMWNEVYRQQINFKTTANQHLIDTVKGRKTGTALDVAMGQGRNVLHLASVGWKVTGIDISEEGIKFAKASAAKQKLKFDAVIQDIDTYDFGTAKWDLVTMIYAGSKAKTIDKIKPSIKKGGLFVVEFFHKEATSGTGIGGFESGALAKQFEGWKILTDVVVEDIADWGLRKTKVVRFTAQKP